MMRLYLGSNIGIDLFIFIILHLLFWCETTAGYSLSFNDTLSSDRNHNVSKRSHNTYMQWQVLQSCPSPAATRVTRWALDGTPQGRSALVCQVPSSAHRASR